MSEYELLELTGIWKASVTTGAGVIFSLVFAYLVAANTIGRSITTAQVAIVNFLFLYAVGLLMAAMHVDLTTIQEFQLEMPRYVERATRRHGFFYWSVLFGMFLMPITSIYYMWSIRHPDTE